MIGAIGWGEVILVIAIVAVVLGATRLPRLARAVGGLRHDVKKGYEDAD